VHYPAIAATPYLSVLRGFWISSLVHTMWQGWYYVFIMIRRKEKIAAGRPTSFTWLRRSYAKTWIGKWVNSLPEPLQPFSFMGIQVPSISTVLIKVRLFVIDDDSHPIVVCVNIIVYPLHRRGLRLVNLERCHILRRHFRKTLPKGIRGTPRTSRKVAKQSTEVRCQ